MFGNGGNYNNGYLPDGTYVSPAMARMGYMPNNFGGYPIMNNNMAGSGGNFNNVNPMLNQQQMQQPKLNGRIVTNVEEVKGILIEPDGTTYYFPCPAENCIYTKTIDLNAQSVINVYRLSNNTLPVYADMQTVQGINERLSSIEQMLFTNNGNAKGGMTNDKQQPKQHDDKSNGSNV